MYNRYLGDPNLKRLADGFQSLCAPNDDNTKLVVINGCFSIVKGDKIITEFCPLNGLNFNVDGYSLIDVELAPGDVFQLFDNNTDEIPDGDTLDANRAYTRGFILFAKYPTKDDDGETLVPSDENFVVKFYDRSLGTFSVGVQSFFSHFSNPYTTDPEKIANTVELINSNANYSVCIKGLLITSKSSSETSTNDTCNC